MIHKYTLTRGHQHSKRCKDGKRRNFLLFYLNDILILKQKRPFDENREKGFDGIWFFKNIYLLNGYLYQTRVNSKKSRDVKFPISKKILKQFNIPKDLKILLNNE